MNNYIDERIIPYKRPQAPVNRYVRADKGRPLTRKSRNDGIVMNSLRFFAAIFLLLLSTFGGDSAEQHGKAEINVEKVVKSCVVYSGIALALWGVLVVVSNLVNAVTLLPTWSLILVFAATVLIAAGFLKK